jgi:hypothetical protein
MQIFAISSYRFWAVTATCNNDPVPHRNNMDGWILRFPHENMLCEWQHSHKCSNKSHSDKSKYSYPSPTFGFKFPQNLAAAMTKAGKPLSHLTIFNLKQNYS